MHWTNRNCRWLGAIVALLVAGCGVRVPEQPAPTVVEPFDPFKPAPPPPSVVPGDGADPLTPLPVAPPPETVEAPAAEPPPSGFAWTKTPKVASAPAKPAVGYVTGRPATVKRVEFIYELGRWRLVAQFEPREGEAEGGRLTIDLPALPQEGVAVERPLRPGGGTWRITDPEEPSQLTDWGPPVGYQVRLSTRAVTKYRASGPREQEVGTVSGRLAVVLQGSRRFPDAWLAGTFTDAKVRYLEPPGS